MRHRALIAMGVVLASGLVRAQEPEAAQAALLKEQLAARVEKTFRESGAVGLAVGVVKDREVFATFTSGFADREGRVPVDGATMFRWASISKPLTAIAAMQMVEAGLLDLDADIRVYLPSFPEKTRPITMKQLLSNTGGIGHYNELGRAYPAWQELKAKYPAGRPFNADAAVGIFAAAPLAYEPGTKNLYSTFGFVLAGAVLDAIARKQGVDGYAGWVEARIARPMGMTTLRPDYVFERLPRALGYELARGGTVIPEQDVEEDVTWKLPGGGFHSNIQDLTLFAQGLVAGTVLTEASRDLMWSDRSHPRIASGYGLGFGWQGKKSSPRGRTVSHSGSQSKTRTLLVVHPELGVGVTIMTNSVWMDSKAHLSPLARDLIALLAPQ